MRPTAPMFPRSTRRSSILSRPFERRSEPLLKNATVVIGRSLAREAVRVAGQRIGEPGTLLGAAPRGVIDFEANSFAQRNFVLGHHPAQIGAVRHRASRAASLDGGAGFKKRLFQADYRLRPRAPHPLQGLDGRYRAPDIGQIFGHVAPQKKSGRRSAPSKTAEAGESVPVTPIRWTQSR